MKFNHLIKIDFFKWLKHGKFDYLKFGQTKEWIFRPIRRLTLSFVMETLLANEMYFTTRDTGTCAIEVNITETNFSFQFEPLYDTPRDIKNFRCVAFWMKEK